MNIEKTDLMSIEMPYEIDLDEPNPSKLEMSLRSGLQTGKTRPTNEYRDLKKIFRC